MHALVLTLSLAAFGVELPTMGITFDHSWPWTLQHYFSAAVAQDIATNLRADYVRTGWIPDWIHKFHSWHRENQALDAICGAGLHVMIIVPGVQDDALGEDDLLENVRAFFARYTQREPGCIRYAEIANETNLPANGFRSVLDYASYYAKVSPIVASFGIPVITSGVSGADSAWISELGERLRSMQPPPPVSAYGFHPYGVPLSSLATAFDSMQRAAGELPGGKPSAVDVTEMGRTDAAELYRAIVTLAPLTGALTVYEYRAQPNDSAADARYALVDHPALYDAARRAFADARATAARTR
ncbi:MAG TPA: hypothetical protein VMF61_05125 [Candidatus Acidoferrales bacterium]|nr:hypothetical protein [Candidatus Acidoferrales bacterium]